MLYCVEIVGRTPIRVARGAFHLKLMMIMMTNTWEARARGAPPWIDDENDDRDEADDDEYKGSFE